MAVAERLEPRRRRPGSAQPSIKEGEDMDLHKLGPTYWYARTHLRKAIADLGHLVHDDAYDRLGVPPDMQAALKEIRRQLVEMRDQLAR
jgi:hypothetical protein